MSREVFRCPLCSFEFDPATNPACGTCPLHNGCAMLCCPHCGHSTIDPSRSRLGRWAGAIWGRRKHSGASAGRGHAGWRHGEGSWGRPSCAHCLSLAQAPVGRSARVVDLDGLPPGRKLQLQALGLAPGRRVWVQQQLPCPVVLCGHSELALEAELAEGVLIELED